MYAHNRMLGRQAISRSMTTHSSFASSCMYSIHTVEALYPFRLPFHLMLRTRWLGLMVAVGLLHILSSIGNQQLTCFGRHARYATLFVYFELTRLRYRCLDISVRDACNGCSCLALDTKHHRPQEVIKLTWCKTPSTTGGHKTHFFGALPADTSPRGGVYSSAWAVRENQPIGQRREQNQAHGIQSPTP